MKYIVVITIFCLLVLFSSFLHNSFLDEYIEKDLEAKTKAILKENGLDSSNVDVNGHHLDVSIASSLSNTTLEALDGVIGIYLPVESGSTYNPADDPSVAVPVNYSAMDFRVERRGGAVYLSGDLPDREYQLKLLYLLNANANDLEVIDQTIIAEKPDYKFWWDGKPAEILPDFLNGSEGNGYVHFMAYDFEASASFTNEEAYQNVKGRFERIPHGVIQDKNITYSEPAPEPKINLEEILIPVNLKSPRLFLIEDINDNLVLRGTVDSVQAKKGLIVAVNVAIPTGKNVNFTKSVKVSEQTSAFSSLSRIKNLVSEHIQKSEQAELSYTDKGMTLKGVLDNDKERQALIHLAKQSVDKGIRIDNQLRVKGEPIPTFIQESSDQILESERLVGQLKLLPVYFETGSAVIQEDQELKIKKAALIIQQAKTINAELTVGGYADTRGAAEVNEKLSIKRANAVKDKLIEHGVSAERLNVQHFGEDVSSLSPEELWRARRVAISLTTVQ